MTTSKYKTHHTTIWIYHGPTRPAGGGIPAPSGGGMTWPSLERMTVVALRAVRQLRRDRRTIGLIILAPSSSGFSLGMFSPER